MQYVHRTIIQIYLKRLANWLWKVLKNYHQRNEKLSKIHALFRFNSIPNGYFYLVNEPCAKNCNGFRHSFPCTNGCCIEEYWTCDGKDDCGDGSDENNSFCSIKKCNELEFMCDNYVCMKNIYKCDNIPHCKDGSDEKGCPLGKDPTVKGVTSR